MPGYYDLTQAERIALTKRAIAERATQVERWRVLPPAAEIAGWDARTTMAADWLARHAAVVDFGCGTMALERRLAGRTAYLPVDLAARDERTVVCDLNLAPPPALDADACACLGLLEYVHDLEGLMAALAQSYRACVASYNPTDAPAAPKPVAGDPFVGRRAYGWVNDFTRAGIETLFLRAGWRIEATREIDPGQTLWRLASRPRPPVAGPGRLAPRRRSLGGADPRGTPPPPARETATIDPAQDLSPHARAKTGAGTRTPPALVDRGYPLVFFNDRLPGRVRAYISGGIDKVEGWGVDGYLARVFLMLGRYQELAGVKGNLFELGVHHGRTAVLLALMARRGETAAFLDLFERQDENIDNSGRGSRDIFAATLAKWAPKAPVEVIQANSLDFDFRASPALNAGLRFAHIDGAHYREAVINDLVKTSELMCDGGVVVVDDFMHSGFPGVNEACNAFLEGGGGGLAPVAIGHNKLVLTTRALQAELRTHLGARVLPPYGRVVTYHGCEVVCLDGH